MADNETTEDIIAWLRRPREGENAYLTLWRDEIADRIEAAQKRERGNCAKLREALEAIRRRLVAAYESEASFIRYSPNKPLVDLIDAALAAPARNCDRPECATTTAAQGVWRKEDGGKTAYYDWLLASATEKEGGTK